jgi:hypothetical protein
MIKGKKQMKKQATLGDADGQFGETDFFGLDEFGLPTSREAHGALIGAGVGAIGTIAVQKYSAPGSKLRRYAEGVGMIAGVAVGGAMMLKESTKSMGYAAAMTALVANGLRQVNNMLFPQKYAVADLQNMMAYATSAGGGYVDPLNYAAPAYAAPMPVTVAPAYTAPAPAPAGYTTQAALPAATGASASAGTASSTTSTGTNQTVTTTSPATSGWGGTVINPAYRAGRGGFGIHAIEPGYNVPGGGFGTPVIQKAFPVASPGFGAAMKRSGPPTLVGAGDYGLGRNPGVSQLGRLGGPAISAMGAHFGSTLFGANG